MPHRRSSVHIESQVTLPSPDPNTDPPTMPARSLGTNTDISFSSLQKFHLILTRQFYKLGHLIASSPTYFIILPIFITLFFSTGIQTMIYEKNPEYLFSPLNYKGSDDRRTVSNLFPLNYTYNFDPSRIISLSSPFVRLIVTAKDNDTILRVKIFQEIAKLDAIIQNTSIVWEDRPYRWVQSEERPLEL